MRLVTIILFNLFFCFSSFSSKLISEKLVAANSYYNVNLPPFSYFTDSSPKVDHSGNIVFDFYTIDSGSVVHGILYFEESLNKTRPLVLIDNSEIINHVSFSKKSDMQSSSDEIIFATHDGGAFKGLYRQTIDSSRNNYRKVTLPKDDYLAISTSSFFDDHSVVRLNDSKKRELILINDQGFKTIAKEGEDGVNFIHSPKLEGNYILYKLRYGQRGSYSSDDKERLILSNTSNLNSTVILSNDGEFDRLENMYNVNKKGNVVAFVRKNQQNFIVANLNGKMKVILDLKNNPLIGRVDLFTPAINEKGHILIRGYDKLGNAGLFLYKDNKWSELIKEGHELTHQNTVYKLSKSSTGQMIKGSVDFNNNGNVVFNTFLSVDKTILEGIVTLTYSE